MALNKLKNFFNPDESDEEKEDLIVEKDPLEELGVLDEEKKEAIKMDAKEIEHIKKEESEDLNAKISIALLETRIERQLSEKEFMELVKISSEELRAISDFKFDPTIKKLDEICEILNMNMRLEIQ